MRAIDRKVLRDLWLLRGQALAIGLVIASGVAALLMSLSTLNALRETADAYYERYRLADVFASLKRAPTLVESRIAAIPNVKTVQTRIVQFATLDVTGFAEPVIGQLVSIPEGRQPLLNQFVLRSGRLVEKNRPDEVILNEPFALAHNLVPGDQLKAVLNGHQRTLKVVGTALAPEFIYSIGPGALIPDDQRFGVLWMGREALEAAFDLKEAFNNVVLKLNRGADPETVIQRLDQVLTRYGGIGAIARKDQLSAWFVANELKQLATQSKMLPTIFLLVAAFLTHMVLGRLIATERSQIGLMKAFGYSNLEVASHYAKLVAGVALIGIVLGLALGSWLGRVLTELYGEQFRFPTLLYAPSVSASVLAVGVSLLAAFAGAAGAVRGAALLPPAQAMLPPAPLSFRRTRFAASALGRWLDQPSRIVLRNIGRFPSRAALTTIGVAASVGLLVLALQWRDSLDYLAQSYFFDAQRQHVMLGFAEPHATTVVREVAHMPGVLAVEPTRFVSADLSVGPVTHRGALVGTPSQAILQPIYDDIRRAVVPTPPAGLVLGTWLAKKLQVGIGETVWVQILEGRRPLVELPVVDLIQTYIGTPAYIHINALNRLLKERPSVQYVSLLVDQNDAAELYRELKGLPAVSAVMVRRAAVDSFQDTIARNLMVFISMFAPLACGLGFGVAYNSTRIALSERGRELATLRVLGFSRGEISYILLGEVGLLILLALPLGCVLGYLLSVLMAASFSTELFRVPLTIAPSTYGVAVVIALAATILSAAVVRQRLDRLNLVEVLKTRE